MGPLIDIDANSASLKIEGKIYVKILTRAVEQTRGDLTALESAIPIGDTATIQAVSHRLKGDYDNLRVAPLAEAARELNETVKAGADKDRMAEAFGRFKDFFQRLDAFLQERVEE